MYYTLAQSDGGQISETQPPDFPIYVPYSACVAAPAAQLADERSETRDVIADAGDKSLKAQYIYRGGLHAAPVHNASGMHQPSELALTQYLRGLSTLQTMFDPEFF